MAEIYTCRMSKTITFDIKADSIEEAQDWCATHDFEDVQNQCTYWDIDYSEEVSEFEDDGYVAVDSSEQYEHTPKEMAEKLMEFVRDFSDYEDDIKNETNYLTEVFDKLQKSTEFNALAHHLDIMFMNGTFKSN